MMHRGFLRMSAADAALAAMALATVLLAGVLATTFPRRTARSPTLRYTKYATRGYARSKRTAMTLSR